MSKSKWTENQIEDLLKQMPSISDSRHPLELFKIISTKLPKKKRPVWMIPGLASAAAILLFIILIPNFTGFKETAQESKMVEQKNSADMVDNDASSLKYSKKKDQESTMNSNLVLERSAVYQEDLVSKELLVFGIPDVNAQNIAQVSILVNKDEAKSWFQHFIETMPHTMLIWFDQKHS